jgi:TM2 domain-containing membrane protein YozV
MLRSFIVFFLIIIFNTQKSSATSKADDFLFHTTIIQCSNIDSLDFFQFLKESNVPSYKIKFIQKLWDKNKENPRVIAFCLAILLGPFGAHRIYLGTRHMVPVAYVLTLGGGLGVVPVIDAILILATKNLEPYQNNPRFFMWTSKEDVE